ncbi:hypothetical protein PVAP13_8NG198801 [Panicum virgatum]|uniref:Uncharacterized protein n=1 Tax=Panicum virgatum TaxID=38727 RepID=A0A8T0PDM0_PANVG|nr:hypothetical protein PVAP13_8NG198801 [Panicum virgatum]
MGGRVTGKMIQQKASHIVNEIKGNNDLKYVYVWHAITEYWGGVRPGIVGMEHYESKMQHASTLCHHLEFRKTNPVMP